jgi:hypothetical protein
MVFLLIGLFEGFAFDRFRQMLFGLLLNGPEWTAKNGLRR